MITAKVNEEIRSKTILLVLGEGTKEMELESAIELAESKELDIVQVGLNGDMPVCKIIDYKKFLYEQKKRDKKNQSNSKQIKLKEIKLRDGIAEHDKMIKAKSVQDMITEGYKVHISIRYPGRMRAFIERGIEILDDFASQIQEAEAERKPVIDGGIVYMILKPIKKKR